MICTAYFDLHPLQTVRIKGKGADSRRWVTRDARGAGIAVAWEYGGQTCRCGRAEGEEAEGPANHLSLQVLDLETSLRFYDAVLAPLGGRRVMEFGDGRGVREGLSGASGSVERRIGCRTGRCTWPSAQPPTTRCAPFFAAAVATGAEVLHEPRVWPEYHPGYFGAFVRDPDGNNVEAVHHNLRRPDATTRASVRGAWQASAGQPDRLTDGRGWPLDEATPTGS